MLCVCGWILFIYFVWNVWASLPRHHIQSHLRCCCPFLAILTCLFILKEPMGNSNCSWLWSFCWFGSGVGHRLQPLSLLIVLCSTVNCIWGGPKSLQPQTQEVTTDFWPLHGSSTYGHLLQSHHWSHLQVSRWTEGKPKDEVVWSIHNKIVRLVEIQPDEHAHELTHLQSSVFRVCNSISFTFLVQG